MAGLLTIPRELRNAIYLLLLRQDTFLIQQHSSKYDRLSLSILRVNKQLNAEAKKTLFNENRFVEVSIAESVYNDVIKCEVTVYENVSVHDRPVVATGFPGQRPVSNAKGFLRAHKASLLMVVNAAGEGASQKSHFLLVPLAGFSRFCRYLTDVNAAKRMELELRVPTLKDNRHTEDLEVICRSLRQARGCGSVRRVRKKISGDIGRTMVRRYANLREVQDLLLMYRVAWGKAQAEGRCYAARDICQECIEFTDWFYQRDRYRDLPGRSSETKGAIAMLRAEFGFASARCSLQLNEPKSARAAVELTYYSLKMVNQWPRSHQIEAYYLMGLVFVAMRAQNAAAYAFYRVLLYQPGHPGADAALDEMVERVTFRIGRDNLTAECNIRTVIQPFRHQSANRVISDDELETSVFFFWTSLGSAGRRIQAPPYPVVGDRLFLLDPTTNKGKTPSI